MPALDINLSDFEKTYAALYSGGSVREFRAAMTSMLRDVAVKDQRAFLRAAELQTKVDNNLQELKPTIAQLVNDAVQTELDFIRHRASNFDDVTLRNRAAVRLELLYRNATAHVVAMGQQLTMLNDHVRSAIPFYRYVARRDSRARITHRAMHGLIAVVDWTGWDSIMPPCGYNCRCRVEPIGYAKAERMGLVNENGWPVFGVRWPSVNARKFHEMGAFPDRGWWGPKTVARLVGVA
jgi:SPP1 gp7 family putative phage head morphogenesis protein